MTAHTQGNWEMYGKNVNGEILIGKQGEEYNSGKIVRVGWCCCGQDSKECEAKAKLIATLKTVSAIMQKWDKEGTEKDYKHIIWYITEAINKATQQ